MSTSVLGGHSIGSEAAAYVAGLEEAVGLVRVSLAQWRVWFLGSTGQDGALNRVWLEGKLL